MQACIMKCIIHYPASDDDNSAPLTKLKDYLSWLTLLEAARVRCHVDILKIAESLAENEVPELYYHLQCRSRFILERELETLKRQANADEDATSSATIAKRLNMTSSPSRVYEAECIFCGKEKSLKGTLTREKPIQAAQLRVEERLRECATRKQDVKILAVTSRDIVAAEAHYHNSCYRNYNRVKDVESKATPEDDSQRAFKEIEANTYVDLFAYIRNDIIPAKKIMPVAQLTARMDTFIESNGVTQFHDTIKTNKLKTFSSFTKQRQIRTQADRTVILKADRSLFGCIIVMAQNRNLHMAEILSYPLGPLPWALATREGFSRKTNKATLATAVQNNVAANVEMPEYSAVIVDGMSFVQRVKGDQTTFGEVGQTLLLLDSCLKNIQPTNQTLLSIVVKEGLRIAVVFDTYNDISIKTIQRRPRGEQQGQMLQSITSQLV